MPRLKTTRTTAKHRLETSRRYYRYGLNDWIDPFPEIMGTSIEKRIYARLILLQIPFEFQSMITVNIPQIGLVKDYRPDIILPDQKVIIEIQGSYWHSTPAAIEADSYKYALYTAMGWRVLTWWDYEILHDIDALFARDLGALLASNYVRGGRRIDPAKQKIIDDLKGLRTMNARKRKPYRTFIGAKRGTLKKARSNYGK